MPVSVEQRRGSDETRPCRILILGDGNFSFSLALARALLLPLSPSTTGKTTTATTARCGKPSTPASHSHPAPATGTRCAPVPTQQQPPAAPGNNQRRPPYDIVATSFDGRLDLLGKYPESSSILANLRLLGVTVLHNVDATALDERVVGGAGLDGDQSQREPSRHTSLLVVAGGTQHSSRNTACSRAVSAVTATPQQDHAGAGPQHGEEPAVSRGREWRGDAAAGGGSGGAPTSWSSSTTSRQYDHVIFNHPHTGTEDMRRHRSFLGHFFHALLVSSSDTDGANGVAVTGDGVKGVPVQSNSTATGVLATGGVVHVTLAGDQPERWGLREQAARHGFSMLHRRRFPAERIDGFMTKRHQTGKSFQRRNLDSATLSFVWGERVDSEIPSSVGRGAGESVDGVFSDGADGVERCDADGSEKEAETEDGCAGGGCRSSLPPWLWPDVDVCGKGASREGHGAVGRGREQHADAGQQSDDAASPVAAVAAAAAAAVAGRENHASMEETKKSQHSNHAAGRSSPLVLLEACTLCGKRYKTAQAVRTHTRQVHELGQEGGMPLVEDSKEEPCPHCDRVFTSARALDQHVSAKHSGDFVDIKPDWFVGSIYHVDPPLETAAVDGGDDDQALERNGVSGEACSIERLNHAVGMDDGLHRPVEATRVSDSSSSGSGGGGGGDGGGAVQCGVCEFWFLTRDDARQHLDNLRPPIEDGVAHYECQSCFKEFGSRRALLQHANFCNK